MNYLSRFSRKEKIGLLYIPFFAIGMVVSSITMNPPAPADGPTTASIQSSPSPSATSPQSAVTASATPTQASAPITFANEDVPRAELTLIQQRADAGLTNFYQWKSGESTADRNRAIFFQCVTRLGCITRWFVAIRPKEFFSFFSFSGQYQLLEAR